MACGSCRQPRSGKSTTSPSSPCAQLEQAGAKYIVYPTITATSLLLSVEVAQGGRRVRVDLSSLLDANRCDGPTCRWLRSELPSIVTAARRKPELFRRYSHSGLGLADLARIAHAVLKE